VCNRGTHMATLMFLIKSLADASRVVNWNSRWKNIPEIIPGRFSALLRAFQRVCNVCSMHEYIPLNFLFSAFNGLPWCCLHRLSFRSKHTRARGKITSKFQKHKKPCELYIKEIFGFSIGPFIKFKAIPKIENIHNYIKQFYYIRFVYFIYYM